MVLVDPFVLDFLKGKGIDVEKILEGYQKGKHRSPFIGQSIDYKDYRPYERGDELKFIDWRVFGRTERFYVRRFEEETNIRVYIVQDISASMGVENKGDLARKVSAVISYLSYLSRDAFGLFLFNSQEVYYLPPASKHHHLLKLYNILETFQDHGLTDFLGSITSLTYRIKKRSLIVVVSDFFFPVEDFEKFVKFFKGRGHELLIIPLISRREFKVRDAGVFFKDAEKGFLLPADMGTIKELEKGIVEHYERLRDVCKRFGIRIFEFNVEEDFNFQLRKFFEG
ncbi:MAG: DUF58 domain-containing protein [Candidatus Hydrothermia bacterium]